MNNKSPFFTLIKEGLLLGSNRCLTLESLLTIDVYRRAALRIEKVKCSNVKWVLFNSTNGKIVFDFEREGIEIELQLNCFISKLECEISLISESKTDEFLLMSASLTAYLLQASLGGKLLMNSYAGFLADVPNGSYHNLSRLYMGQEEWEKFNMLDCFGVFDSKLGNILAIVDKGAFFAFYETKNLPDTSSGTSVVFGFRHTPAEQCNGSKKVCFYNLDCNANWTSAAFVYRKHLAEREGLVPLTERKKNNPILDYQTTALCTKIFMGQKVPPKADGSGKYCCCTTFAEAESMLQQMYDYGIRQAVIILVGWNKYGHDGEYPTRFPVNEFAGGEKGLRQLIIFARNLGYQIVPHDNWTDVYTSSAAFNTAEIALDTYGLLQSSGVWAGGMSYKRCPLIETEHDSQEREKIFDLGFYGCYYMDAQSTGLFRCQASEHPADEELFALKLAEKTIPFRKHFGAVSCENPQAYTLKYIDSAATIPAETPYRHYKERLPDSFQKFKGSLVPFYHIAIHGYITYQNTWVHNYPGEDKVPYLLNELLLGARPSMEVSKRALSFGGDFESSLTNVLPFYKLQFEIMPEIHTSLVESYELFSHKAAKIVYSCGTTIEVNAQEEFCKELNLEGRSCRVIRNNKIVFEKTFNK